MTLDILYFAWARERLGTGRERVETGADTVGELINELAARTPHHAALFAEPDALRCAVDQELATPDTRLAGAREVAFFPPMTGG